MWRGSEEKRKVWFNELALQVKPFATEPHDPGSNPMTSMVEGKKELLKAQMASKCFPHELRGMHIHEHTCTYTHT